MLVKTRYFLYFYCIFFAATGCNNDNPASTDTLPKNGTTINFVINEFGMHNLRTGEFYFLWLKIAPDTIWKAEQPLTIKYSSNLAVMVGTLTGNITIDSINNVLVTIEQKKDPLIPGTPILQSRDFYFDSVHKTSSAFLDHSKLFADYSALQGSLVFTSKSSDSLAYTHEFYLMNLQGATQTASLTSLPTPPTGWKYGLWAEDTSFTPHQYFFYGLFSTPTGHDSDSTNDYYPFPGGWKIQQMNMPRGSIIVTLEPLSYGDSLKYIGPSPFTLLTFNRMRFIDKNKNYLMTNISGATIPAGSITFQKF